MLQVTVDKVVVTKTKVSLGLVIKYSPEGPVRFAQAELPLGLMSPHVLGLLLAAWDRANLAEDLEDVPVLF
jgi:hypothetical protein